MISPLEQILARFYRGESSLDQLGSLIGEISQLGREAVFEAGQTLEAEHASGKLSSQFYRILMARLGNPSLGEVDDGEVTRLAGKAQDLEATQIAAPEIAAEEAVTELGSRPSVDPVHPTGTSAQAASHTGTDWSAVDFSAEPVQNLRVGDVLKDRFELLEILGVGGMGMVFKALDRRKIEASDRDSYVALKVLSQDFRSNPVSLIALQREAKKAQRLSHPNIIDVYDFDRDGAHVFMSMEYLEGQPLNQVIRDLPKGGMPYRKAWPLIEAMGLALAYAHRRQIVHSDFKPGNVFINEQNEVKVLDFGIACAAGGLNRNPEDATVFDARTLGALTPAYASLEMLQGLDPDPRDDLYALACVSYELLSGKHPFGKLSAEKALELNLVPKPIPGLGRRQWKELQRALALKRDQRTASVGEFLKRLQPRTPVIFGIAVLGILAVALSAGNLYFNLTQTKDSVPKANIELSPEQQAKLKDYLELANIHFDVGYLTAPTGSNALWAYQEALKIDPYNEDAINGIQRIADTLEQEAWEAYERGDRPASLKKLLDGLEAVPQHKGLLKLQEKLRK